MARFEPERRAWIGRVSFFRVMGVASILTAAPVLASLPVPQAAQAQGSELAATTSGPRGGVVDGVPLIPASNEQRGECRTFADNLKRPAPCPGLLPDPIPVSPTTAATLCPGDYEAFGEGSCGPAAIEVNRNLFELSQSNFQVPPGYVGVSFEQNNGTVAPDTSISGGPLGHFVFMAGTGMEKAMTNRRTKGAPPVPPYCLPLDLSSPIRVHGHSAKLYQCGDASNSQTQTQIVEGHTLLVWNDGGITCEVSFHGHSQVNVDLDVAVADATVMVSPRRR